MNKPDSTEYLAPLLVLPSLKDPLKPNSANIDEIHSKKYI